MGKWIGSGEFPMWVPAYPGEPEPSETRRESQPDPQVLAERIAAEYGPAPSEYNDPLDFQREYDDVVATCVAIIREWMGE